MTPALAHPEGQAIGMAAGLWHPLSGADHLLALLGAGFWAAQQGRPAALVCSLLLAMGAGMALAPVLPGLELGLSLTVLLIGVLAAVRTAWLRSLAVLLTSAFAFVHGCAHGLELSGLPAALGMLLTSAALLCVGAVSAKRLPRAATAWLLSGAGLVLTLSSL